METKQIEFSNRVFIVIAVLIGGIVFSFLAGVMLNIFQLPVFQPRELIITGEGKVFAAPDIALIKLGVTNEGMDVSVIVQKNTEQMNKILKELKALGIEEKDIKTTQYSLTPRYEYPHETGERVFKGYVMAQKIGVKIRDFEKIGNALNIATQNGATLVGDLSFSIDEPEKIRQQAREKAIEQAKTKAESIARASGLKLGKVLNVQENYYPYYGGGLQYEAAAPNAVPTPEIQPGQEEVSVTVVITYRVR